jgi:phosphoglycolate phosphatase
VGAPVLEKKKEVAMVVFDLDGTLIDSRDDIATAVEVGLEAVGEIPVPRDEIYSLIGRPLREMFTVFLKGKDQRVIDDGIGAYRSYYFDHCTDRTRLYPGVEDCLNLLDGMPLAIATTKKTFMAVRVIENLQLSHRFEMVHGTDGIPYKPDPTVINQVLKQCGHQPKRSWMVGDTIYDIQAGKAANMNTCAVTYGIGRVAHLVAEEPDIMVDNLSEFGRFLSG